ncbi:MAG: c-type cytochrome [Gammaproteobacteria bacterium]|nr:c-type cytochrome [Gammaproteobacteria bacterium]
MRILPLSFIVAALVAGSQGCSEQDVPPVNSPPAAATSAPVNRLEVGLRAYQAACSACHDDGVNGAPKTGQPADWDGRSMLWQAVLFDHAQRGYLAMPPQKDDAGKLTTQQVQAAAEYMLTLTHPDVPTD